MTTYLPATNILINALNGRRGHKELLRALVVRGDRLACCAITISELFSGIRPGDVAKVEECPMKSSLIGTMRTGNTWRRTT